MEIKNPVSQNIRIKHLQYRNVNLRRALISELTQTYEWLEISQVEK